MKDRVSVLHQWFIRIKQAPAELLLWILALILALKVPGDPDMGWHLANGQYTLQHWVQRGDVYSWTMPHYPWISHEWLTEVGMVLMNRLGGLWGLSVLFSVIVVLSFWLAARADKQYSANAIAAAVIGIAVCYPIIGVRPQMLTLLGMAVTLWLLFTWRNRQDLKFLWRLPLLFLIWANLHAGFAAGFILIAVFGIAELLRWWFTPTAKRRQQHTLTFNKIVWLAGISVLSAAVTLINPYGWRLYGELWTTLTKPEILNRIAEWLPVNFASISSYNLIIASTGLLILLGINRFKVDYTKLTLAIAFFFISITSWRNLALFAIVSMPLISEQLQHLFSSIAAHWQTNKISLIALAGIAVITGWYNLHSETQILASPANYALANSYPYGAVKYIKQHHIQGKLYNEYNWGGYLIWQLPEMKVFIDGRMAIWETPKLKIFEEFQDLMGNHRSTTLKLLNKWDIDLVMTAPTRGINAILPGDDSRWVLLYQDSVVMLWQRADKYHP